MNLEEMGAKLKERSAELFKLGLVYDGQTFTCKDCKVALNFHYTDLMELSDARYEKVLETHAAQCDNLNKIDCPECDGDGYNVTSCCGDDIKGNDTDLCPSCLEHQGMEHEKCDNCNGSGETTKRI